MARLIQDKSGVPRLLVKELHVDIRYRFIHCRAISCGLAGFKKTLIDCESLCQQKAENVAKIKVDYAKCVGEAGKICVEICPVSVFRNEKSEKPEVVNEENCILCRTCQVNCPSQAIEIFA